MSAKALGQESAWCPQGSALKEYASVTESEGSRNRVVVIQSKMEPIGHQEVLEHSSHRAL